MKVKHHDNLRATVGAKRLAEQFEPYIGKRLLGVCDGMGVIEIVFEGDRGNLLSLAVYEDGTTHVGHGFVSFPEEYADQLRIRSVS